MRLCVARVILEQAPCQHLILMILASWTHPEVAAVNGLVADRHLGMCILYIHRFVRARFRTLSVPGAAGGGRGERAIDWKWCLRLRRDLFARSACHSARPPSRVAGAEGASTKPSHRGVRPMRALVARAPKGPIAGRWEMGPLWGSKRLTTYAKSGGGQHGAAGECHSADGGEAFFLSTNCELGRPGES